MGYNIAVCGATGNVGREMLNILAERLFPVDELTALASRRSLGTECSFGDKVLKTKDLDTFDFKGIDIALFAVGAEATKLFGESYLGLISAILTILILIISEIIPKTIGANYWRSLSKITYFELVEGKTVCIFDFLFVIFFGSA